MIDTVLLSHTRSSQRWRSIPILSSVDVKIGSEEQRHARAALAEPLLSKDIVSQQIGHADRIL
jgi:hypothetical protein